MQHQIWNRVSNPGATSWNQWCGRSWHLWEVQVTMPEGDSSFQSTCVRRHCDDGSLWFHGIFPGPYTMNTSWSLACTLPLPFLVSTPNNYIEEPICETWCNNLKAEGVKQVLGSTWPSCKWLRFRSLQVHAQG